MEEFAAFLWAFFVFWLDKITNLKMWIWALGNCVNNRHGFVFFSSVISCFILGLYPLVFCCHFLPPAHLCSCVLSPSCVPCAPSQSDSPPTHTPVSHQSRQHCPVHCVSPPAPSLTLCWFICFTSMCLLCQSSCVPCGFFCLFFLFFFGLPSVVCLSLVFSLVFPLPGFCYLLFGFHIGHQIACF